MENVPLRDLLWRVCFRRKLRPHQVTGDTTYGTVENIVAIEDAGIRAYVPLPDFDQRTPLLRQERVHLRRRARRVPLPGGPGAAAPQDQVHRRTTWSTRPTPATCNACPLKAACTDERPRAACPPLLRRGLPRPRARLPRDRGLPEGDAQAAGLGRAALRRSQGLARLTPVPAPRAANVNIEGLLIAAGQNLKRFLAATGWGGAMPRVGASWPSQEAAAACGDLVIPAPAADGADPLTWANVF